MKMIIPCLMNLHLLSIRTHTSLFSSNLNIDVPLFIPKVMSNKVPNLGHTLPEGCSVFSLSDEADVNLTTPNLHSTSYKPVRASRQTKIVSQAASSKKGHLISKKRAISIQTSEGVLAPSATNKDVVEDTQEASHGHVKKKSNTSKSSKSLIVASQKGTFTKRDSNLFLDASSQKGESIKIGQSPMAPCTESAPIPAQTQGSLHL